MSPADDEPVTEDQSSVEDGQPEQRSEKSAAGEGSAGAPEEQKPARKRMRKPSRRKVEAGTRRFA